MTTTTRPATPQEAFLEAICAAPDDDTPRLMYADWLEERGDVYGKFIRVQCEIARMDEDGEGYIDPQEGHTCYQDPCPVCTLVRKYDTLRERELALWMAHSEAWFANFKNFLRWVEIHTWTGPDPDEMTVLNYRLERGHGRVARGFVERIECSTEVFLKHGPDLVRATPLREVRLTDTKPARSAHGHDEAPWYWENDRLLHDHDNWSLPDPLFDLLEGFHHQGKRGFDPYPRQRQKFYTLEELALRAASAAYLAWARLPADQR